MQAEIFVENVAALVAMTAKYAIKDAMSGDPESIEWLDAMIPEWRKHYQPPRADRKGTGGGCDSWAKYLLVWQWLHPQAQRPKVL